jgi:hypothetical protein
MKEVNMSEQLKQVAYTVIRVMGGVILASLIADLANLLDFHWQDWKPVMVAAIAAALVVLANALNPADKRYGLKKV